MFKFKPLTMEELREVGEGVQGIARLGQQNIQSICKHVLCTLLKNNLPWVWSKKIQF